MGHAPFYWKTLPNPNFSLYPSKSWLNFSQTDNICTRGYLSRFHFVKVSARVDVDKKSVQVSVDTRRVTRGTATVLSPRCWWVDQSFEDFTRSTRRGEHLHLSWARHWRRQAPQTWGPIRCKRFEKTTSLFLAKGKTPNLCSSRWSNLQQVLLALEWPLNLVNKHTNHMNWQNTSSPLTRPWRLKWANKGNLKTTQTLDTIFSSFPFLLFTIFSLVKPDRRFLWV